MKKNTPEKTFQIVFVLLILLGILFRARHFLAGRSLWLDEAMLALDILDLSFWELTQQPLPYQQGAPIGFLFIVKIFTLLFGDSEYAFRLYSFGAGIGALFLFAHLAKAYLQKAGALLAVALFAANLHLIYYSAETKQYMGDVFFSLLLLSLLHKLINEPFSARNFTFFMLLNIGVIWFSHPIVFIVAAVGFVLVFHFQKERKAFRFALFNLAFSGISAALLYFLHLRHLSASAFLVSFWDDAFVPFPPTLHWLITSWEELLKAPLALDASPLLIFLLFLMGCWGLWRRSPKMASAIFLTFALVIFAGVLQKYPLAERMLLFVAPSFLLLIAAGLDTLKRLLARKMPKTAWMLILLVGLYLLYAPFSEALFRLKTPLYREHIRPTMAYLKENLREDDLVYVYYYAEPAFLFYLPKYHLEDISYRLGSENQQNPENYLTEIENFEGRVWFLFTHVHENAFINEEAYILAFLDSEAKKNRAFIEAGTSVTLYLYEFR